MLKLVQENNVVEAFMLRPGQLRCKADQCLYPPSPPRWHQPIFPIIFAKLYAWHLFIYYKFYKKDTSSVFSETLDFKNIHTPEQCLSCFPPRVSTFRTSNVSPITVSFKYRTAHHHLPIKACLQKVTFHVSWGWLLLNYLWLFSIRHFIRSYNTFDVTAQLTLRMETEQSKCNNNNNTQ